MIYITKSLLEETDLIRPDVYPVSGSDDADSLGDAYCNLLAFMKDEITRTEYCIREALAGVQVLKIDRPIKISISRKFLSYLTPDVSQFKKLIWAAKPRSTEDAIAFLEKSICDAYNSGENIISHTGKVSDLVIKPNVEETIQPNEVLSFVDTMSHNICYYIGILEAVRDEIKTYNNETTIDSYQKLAEMFKVFVRLTAAITNVYTHAYGELYHAVYNKPTAAQQAVIDRELERNHICDKIAKTEDLQKKYTAIRDIPNQELTKRLNTLNEKLSKCEYDLGVCRESADNEMNENVRKYIDNLEKCVKEIREFYNAFKYKELLIPRNKHIDTMDDYVRGALERKFMLKIPLYSMDKATKEAKDIVREQFIPEISKIADKYDDYIVFAPRFDDESDDLFIYLTLREPFGDKNDDDKRSDHVDSKSQNESADSENIIYKKPNGDYIVPSTTSTGGAKAFSSHGVYLGHIDGEDDRECIENFKKLGKMKSQNESWSKSDYTMDRDGRFIKVYSPDGRFLGNCDSYEDASDTIRDDIREHEDKEKKKALNEVALTTEERNKLSDDDFGVPEIKAYPLTDEEHVRKAIQFFHYCKSEYKDTLAKNITRKVISLNLVGKVSVSEKNPFKSKFPEWMLEGKNAKMEVDGNTYKIFVNDKEVDHGTIPAKKTAKTITESIVFDPKTGHSYM